MVKWLSVIFWLVIILLGACFSILNAYTVVLHYYLGRVVVFFPVLLLSAVFFGVLLGVIAMLPKTMRSNKSDTSSVDHEKTK